MGRLRSMFRSVLRTSVYFVYFIWYGAGGYVGTLRATSNMDKPVVQGNCLCTGLHLVHGVDLVVRPPEVVEQDGLRLRGLRA